MTRQLDFEIQPQPDDTTCGPTCLHALYRYYGDDVPLARVIDESSSFDDGGTLAVLLACHALRRGYRSTIYSYNLTVFDPTWFTTESVNLVERLLSQAAAKTSPKLQAASRGYIDFLQLGGEIRSQVLNGALIRHYLNRDTPILTGLSSTYLYQTERETEPDGSPDDICGVPNGHFVVLRGYDKQQKTVSVADPYLHNPLGEYHHYEVSVDRLVCSILLGVLTHDANLLVIEPAN